MRIESLNFTNLLEAFSCVRRIPSWKKISSEVEQSTLWLQHAMQIDFRGKIAFKDDMSVGHIFYAPLSSAPVPLVAEERLAAVRCLYVDPGFRKRGIGSSLIAAMKADVGNYDGVILSASKKDSDMYYPHFKKVGFKIVEENENLVYMFLPVKKDNIQVRIISKKPKVSDNKVQVTLFNDEFCPLRNQLASIVRKAVGLYGDSVELREIDLTPETAKFYGASASYIIDDEYSSCIVTDIDDIVSRIESALTKKGLFQSEMRN